MKKTVIIEGMSCSHCSKRVEDALNRLPNTKASVDLNKKAASVETNEADASIIKAVTTAGYKVTEIK
ncbi:MAG: cation transporter [Clostridia bacterium]|jgi:copper chaperone CopZ